MPDAHTHEIVLRGRLGHHVLGPFLDEAGESTTMRMMVGLLARGHSLGLEDILLDLTRGAARYAGTALLIRQHA